MKESDKKNQLIIVAAKQFLFRLGIKTMLNVIGIEPELYEADNIKKTKTLLKFLIDPDFLLISEDLLPQPKNEYIEKTKRMCPHCKIMVLGDEIINNCPCSHFILNTHSKKEVLKIFQEFFFKPGVFESTNIF